MQIIQVAGARAVVRSYRPGEAHPTHRDPQSRISIVLRGSLREDAAWGSAHLRSGDVIIKSRDVPHEDAFGLNGASILSVLFDDDADCQFRAARLAGRWLVRQNAAALRTSFSIVEAAAARDASAFGVAVKDLLASAHPVASRGRPSVWLTELYRELEEYSLASVNISERARAAGRHPVHVSREFRRCFGVSITEHALEQCVRRALGPLANSEHTLTQIALDAGFYDHSHMIRVFRRVLGRPPSAYRSALKNATRVSDS